MAPIFYFEPVSKIYLAAGSSFLPMLPFENLEIHKVFLQFSNVAWKENTVPSAQNSFSRLALYCDIGRSRHD